MDSKLRTLKCPFCNGPIPSSKEWITVCSNCKTHLELIWHNEKVVSIRRAIYPPSHYLNGSPNELLQAFIDCVEEDLSPEKWGFNKNIRLPNDSQGLTVIYGSELCRIKFVLGGSYYGPVFASFVYYGRLHAPDDKQYIKQGNEICRYWHADVIRLMLPFLEGMSPKQLGEGPNEIFQTLERALNIEHPSTDEIEYPLKLHAAVWERYGKKLFEIFDMRNPELWEKYCNFSNEYWKALYKRLKWEMPTTIEKLS